jgi:hypothetical protein
LRQDTRRITLSGFPDLLVKTKASRVADCSELVAGRLMAVPCILGRLGYTAGHYDTASDRYKEEGLARVFGEYVVDSVLRRFHCEVFLEWLQLSLERQVEDIKVLLRIRDSIDFDVLFLLRMGTHERLLPGDALAAERDLFVSDLGIAFPLAMRGEIR